MYVRKAKLDRKRDRGCLGKGSKGELEEDVSGINNRVRLGRQGGMGDREVPNLLIFPSTQVYTEIMFVMCRV